MSRPIGPPNPFPGIVPGVPGSLPRQHVYVDNIPPPGIDPFLAILYSQFLAGNVWLEYFVFTASWRPLAANAAGAPAQTTIDAGIDFVVQSMNLVAFQGAGHEDNPHLLLEVQETSGRANWSDQPVEVGCWAGSTIRGNHSYWLPCPRYVRGSNTINWKLTNRTAFVYDVDLAIAGTRVTYTNISREELFKVPY